MSNEKCDVVNSGPRQVVYFAGTSRVVSVSITHEFLVQVLRYNVDIVSCFDRSVVPSFSRPWIIDKASNFLFQGS